LELIFRQIHLNHKLAIEKRDNLVEQREKALDAPKEKEELDKQKEQESEIAKLEERIEELGKICTEFKFMKDLNGKFEPVFTQTHFCNRSNEEEAGEAEEARMKVIEQHEGNYLEHLKILQDKKY